MYFNKEEQQISMLNGRCVMATLVTFNNNATKQQLCRHFTSCTDQPRELVEEELNRILENGVNEGFIMKCENVFSLPRKWKLPTNEYQADGDGGDVCVKVEAEEEEEEEEEDEEEDEEEEEEEDDIEEIYKEASADLLWSGVGTKCFHEALMNNIIEFADKQVKAERLMSTETLKEIFSGKKIKQKVIPLYEIAYKLTYLETTAPRKRGLEYRRKLISKFWKESDVDGEIRDKKKELKEAIEALREHNDYIVRQQFLDFSISQVTSLVEDEAKQEEETDDYENDDALLKEIQVSYYHPKKEFSDNLKNFLVRAYNLCKVNDKYDFGSTYRQDDEEEECTVVEPITPIIDLRSSPKSVKRTRLESTEKESAECSSSVISEPPSAKKKKSMVESSCSAAKPFKMPSVPTSLKNKKTAEAIPPTPKKTVESSPSSGFVLAPPIPPPVPLPTTRLMTRRITRSYPVKTTESTSKSPKP